MADGRCFPAQDIILSQRLDLAFFRVPSDFGKPAINGDKVQKGDQIYSAGTTCGEPFFQGVVIAPSFNLYHVDIILPEATTEKATGYSVTQGFAYQGNFSKGFSGGPVVDVSGKLVGINQGRLIKAISNPANYVFASEKTYGLAYHIADVLTEFECLIP